MRHQDCSVCKSGSRVREGLCWCADGRGVRGLLLQAGVLLSMSAALGCSAPCMADFCGQGFCIRGGERWQFCWGGECRDVQLLPLAASACTWHISIPRREQFRSEVEGRVIHAWAQLIPVSACISVVLLAFLTGPMRGIIPCRLAGWPVCVCLYLSLGGAYITCYLLVVPQCATLGDGQHT